MRVIIVILVVLLLILQYQLWFSRGGAFSVIHLHHKIAKQEKINKNLEKKNQVLVSEIKRLKMGKESTEMLARERLGMVKKGEKYYQFVTKKEEKNENSNQ